MTAPLHSLVLRSGDLFQFIVAAVFIGVWILSALITFVRRASEQARRRTQEAARGHQPMHQEPPRPRPIRAEPQPDAPPRQPTASQRELLTDLQTILRDQLGLPVETKPSPGPATPQPEPPERPSRPPEPASPASPGWPPPRAARPAPGSPTPSPASPARPRRRRVPAVPAPSTPRPRVVEYTRPPPAAREARPAPPGPRKPRVAETAEEAYHEHDLEAYRTRREHLSARRSRLRKALSGDSIRQAIVLMEILGKPRAERGWD